MTASPPCPAYIGIDPGRSGAMAVLRGIDVLLLTDLPTTPEGWLDVPRALDCLREVLPAKALVFGAVEQPAAFTPNAGALMTLAISFGQTHALLQQICGRLFTPTPRVWKTQAGLTGDKADSNALVSTLFPQLDMRRLRHDKAEALLLACHARACAARIEAPTGVVLL